MFTGGVLCFCASELFFSFVLFLSFSLMSAPLFEFVVVTLFSAAVCELCL